MTALEWLLLLAAALLLAGALAWHVRDLTRQLDAARRLIVQTKAERDYWRVEAEKAAWGKQ